MALLLRERHEKIMSTKLIFFELGPVMMILVLFHDSHERGS